MIWLWLIVLLSACLSPVCRKVLAVAVLPANYNSDAPSGEDVAEGTQLVTIPTAAAGASPQVFVVEKLTVTQDSRWIVQNNISARPNKQMGIPDVFTGDLELQLPSTTTAPPYLFSEFTMNVPGLGSSVTFIVARTVRAADISGTPTKITIGIRLKLNQ